LPDALLRERGDRRRGRAVFLLLAGLLLVGVMLVAPSARRVVAWPAYLPQPHGYSMGYLPPALRAPMGSPLAAGRIRTTATMDASQGYSMADQVARFAAAQKRDDRRYLDIDSVYSGAGLKDLRVLLTGANRGLGLATAKQLLADGAKLTVVGRSGVPELEQLGATVITGVDVTDAEAVERMAATVGPVDLLINSAGYFPDIGETLGNLNFPEEIKQIDICGLGPLRVTAALRNAGKLVDGQSRVVIISSQAERGVAQDAERGAGRGLRPPHEPRGVQHRRRAHVRRAEAREHSGRAVAPGLLPHGHDGQVRGDLGQGGRRGSLGRSEARALRVAEGGHVPDGEVHQLRGRPADPVVRGVWRPRGHEAERSAEACHCGARALRLPKHAQ
jgi:hypothetical protein